MTKYRCVEWMNHSLGRLLLWADEEGEGEVKVRSQSRSLGLALGLVWLGRVWFGHTKLGPCLIEPLVGFETTELQLWAGTAASIELQILNS